MDRRLWSCAETPKEASLFQQEANRLVGEVLAEVHYVNVDYRSEEFRGEVVGPRKVTSGEEWSAPEWRHPSFDTVDFAVELRTRSNQLFTASWDVPGSAEGVGLREGPAVLGASFHYCEGFAPGVRRQCVGRSRVLSISSAPRQLTSFVRLS